MKDVFLNAERRVFLFYFERIVQIWRRDSNKKNVYYKNVYFLSKELKMLLICIQSKKFDSICLTVWKKQFKFDTLKIWTISKKKPFWLLNIEIEKWCDVLIKNFKQSIFFVLQFFSSKNYFFWRFEKQKKHVKFCFFNYETCKSDQYSKHSWSINLNL